MKNIFKILLSILSLTFLTSCKSRKPFIAKTPLEGKALVYIYFPESLSMSEDYTFSVFTLYIDSKRVQGVIKSREYLSFNLQPKETTFKIVRNDIEEEDVTLMLNQGDIYYLKIEDNLDQDRFDFYRVESEKAQNEITNKCRSHSHENIYFQEN